MSPVEVYRPDLSKRGSGLHEELRRYRRSRILKNIEMLDEFATQLRSDDIFNHTQFRKIRQLFGSQQEWANLVGVSQATIGNYERNVTYPNKAKRAAFIEAADRFRNREVGRIDRLKSIDADLSVDEAKRTLDESILDAAITDFSFDSEEQKIVPITFDSDASETNLEALEQDKKDLFESLSQQADEISASLKGGANINSASLIQALEGYGAETRRPRPNPRKLFRWGSNIAKALANDDISLAISEWNLGALEGFVSDHQELMRLHFREALAKAQEVEAAEIAEGVELPRASEFDEIAGILADAKDEDGGAIFHKDISTLLRDLAREIRENEEAEILTSDEDRRRAFHRRRMEAIKNGSILVGRVLICASFFVVVDPAVALATAGSLASVLGLIEQKAPGTIRQYYERLRSALPFLPRFPSDK